MDEQVLVIAFVAFVVLVTIIALVLRNAAVDDIFSDNKPDSMTDMPFSDKPKGLSSVMSKNSLPSTSSTGLAGDKPAFELNRVNINKIGKIIGAIGAVMIFAPLPDALDGVSFGVAFLGYMMARFTNPPKEPKAGARQSSVADTLRKLASKPEYREAMKILSTDVANKKIPPTEQRQRAIRYLESKGVSPEEAMRNVALLAGYIAQQQRK